MVRKGSSVRVRCWALALDHAVGGKRRVSLSAQRARVPPRQSARAGLICEVSPPDGRQVQRKLGLAWSERGRPPADYVTKRLAEAQTLEQ